MYDVAGRKSLICKSTSGKREREKENEMKRNTFGGAQIKRPLEIWRLMLVFLVIFAGSSVQCAVEREVCRVLGPK